MNIKRVIAVLLAVSILFMAAGCGKKTTDEETSTINIDRVLYPDTDEEVSDSDVTSSSTVSKRTKE